MCPMSERPNNETETDIQTKREDRQIGKERERGGVECGKREDGFEVEDVRSRRPVTCEESLLRSVWERREKKRRKRRRMETGSQA